MITARAVRLAADRNNVPAVVFLMLEGLADLSLRFSGYGVARARINHRIAMLLMAVMIGSVITLILDLDRPQSGLITVSQQPLLDLISDMPSRRAAPDRVRVNGLAQRCHLSDLRAPHPNRIVQVGRMLLIYLCRLCVGQRRVRAEERCSAQHRTGGLHHGCDDLLSGCLDLCVGQRALAWLENCFDR